VSISIINIGGIQVNLVATPFGWEVQYEAGGAIDADGAPTAFALRSDAAALGLKPLDDIHNALHVTTDDPENPVHGWAGVVTDPHGKPVKQTDGPYKSYLVSPTALVDKNYPIGDYRRYVDSRVIPYISVPPQLREVFGVQVGDAALVADRDTGESVQCVVGDIGPRKRLGEVSIACGAALKFKNTSPRNGGVEKGVIVRIFLRSAPTPAWSFSRSAADVAALVDQYASLT
jgi:hypothetical protein